MPSIADRSVVNRWGRRIHVCPDDPRADALIVSGGDLNPCSLQLWGELLRSSSWDLVVDVGANYGEMLLGPDLPAGARVVAFEPNPVVVDLLERSLAEAGVGAEVDRRAVADVVAQGTLAVDPSWSGNSHLITEPDGDGDAGAVPVTVATTTIDDHFATASAQRVCIKIDVEGAEDRVLAGGRHLFSRAEELVLLVEILHCTPAEVAELATAWRVYVYDTGVHGLIRVDPGDVDQLQRLLEQPWIYRQDAVLRRFDRQ